MSMSKIARRSRRGAGGVLVAALLAALAVPALATPAFAAGSGDSVPNDPFVANLESLPVEAAGHSASATFVQATTSASSAFGYGKKTLQAVNDPAAGSTTLEILDATNGRATSSVDVSASFSKIESLSASFVDNDDYEEELRVIVRGEHDGTAALALVSSSTALNFENTAVTSLVDNAAIDLPTLRLLGPSGAGLIAVNETEPGKYVATRLNYDMQVNTARPPVALPFEGAAEIRYDGDSGNFVALREGAIEVVSLYEPSSLNRVTLPGLGQVTRLEFAPAAVLAADAAGHVAVLKPNALSLQSTVSLPGAAGDLAVSQKLNELLATSLDGTQLWRYSLAGDARQTVDTSAVAVQPGSLRSSLGFYAIYTFTANVSGQSYRYLMEYQSRYQVTHTEELRAAERGAGVDLAFVAPGAGAYGDDTDYQWEYSLDGGANWAPSWLGWDKAVPDQGNVNKPLPELPAALDGVAPYLRVDLSAEGNIAAQGISGRMQEFVLPEGSYDGLWRVRVTTTSGTYASAPQQVIVGNGGEDPAVRFTQHPATTAVNLGQEATFTVGVAGDPKPTVTWQIQRPGENWTDLKLTGTEISIPVELTDDKSLVRAIAANGNERVTSQPARITVLSATLPQLGAAPAGAVTVTGANFVLDLNKYSQEWARDHFGDKVQLGAKHGFDFAAGTGWVDPTTGATQLLWDGTAIYRPYGGMNGLNLSLANPYLAIDAAGRGTLTADVFWNNGGGMGGGAGSSDSRGFKRVVLATYVDAKVTVADGALAVAATPEWAHRPYVAPGLQDPTEHPSSFPRSFVDYLDQGLRGWFLATSSRNEDKPGSPIAVSATVTQDAAVVAGAALSATDPLGDGAQHFANYAPKVTTQPQSVHAIAGESATLTAAAEGLPVPSVVWQRQVDGEWVSIAGATKATLQLDRLEAGTFSVRALFSNSVAAAPSATATVTVAAAETPGELNPKPSTDPAAPAADGASLAADKQSNASVTQQENLVTVAGLTANEWYFLTVFSDAQPFGWQRANAAGEVSIHLVRDATKPLEAGAHRVAVQNSSGELVLWGDVRVFGSGTEQPGTDSGQPSTDPTAVATVTGAQLARTGAQLPYLPMAVALLLVAGGAVLLARRSRRSGRSDRAARAAHEGSAS